MNIAIIIARDSVGNLDARDAHAYLDALTRALGKAYPSAVAIDADFGESDRCHVEGSADDDAAEVDVTRLADAVYNDPEGYGWAS